MNRIKEIKEKLSLPLPGNASHVKVMSHRKPIHQLGHIPKGAKQSAVLLLLYLKNNKLHLVFILRSTYRGVHSAQVSFPGGKVEKTDGTFLNTALREADEELAIKKFNLEILGELSPLYVPPSNFIIHPFVAFQDSEPLFVPNKYEVAEIIECPLESLLKVDALVDTTVFVASGKIKTKGFHIGGKILWGATAMIMQELIDVIRS